MAHTLFVPLMLTLGAGLATGIGSTIALFAHRTNKRLLSFSLVLSGGVMTYVSFVVLFQQAREAIGAIYGPQTGMGITTLAFFGGVLLIVVGLLVKRFPMLIAGYNTMPPAKKKNVDIGGLSSCMRRHLVIMGALWILFTVVLELTGQTDTLAVIYVIYLLPYVVWMLVRAQRYDHN